MYPNEKKLLTPAEYDELQSSFECKTEYYNGDIVMSSDTSDKHNEIVLNIVVGLKSFFKGTSCGVRAEQIEVIFGESDEYKLKPDVFVICENDKKVMRGESYTTPPKIIFEIISKSTARYDRVTKFQIYKKYGVIEYNIVEQDGTIIQCALQETNFNKCSKEFSNNDTYRSIVYPELTIELKDIF